ncbi:CDP-alcohol phosphatidyltransferase family protein [Histidinibacterium lentulum]|uniref:CDP-alcohol phosphatidyltransferase family protein n=1 Tax=Histidinibacterium lentulum TaxID=2480588 RepID=A0A3N2QSD7_9RHOB|nr:CDP-alcohol phosphatidyltransferase family protein [Histidinibacterium lentulum]ROT98094.1 CDP-alcohol phosphatidyltransferase family protein [Histidinibacterium lentulum]
MEDSLRQTLAAARCAPDRAGPLAGLLGVALIHLALVTGGGIMLGASFPAIAPGLPIAIWLNSALTAGVLTMLWMRGRRTFGHARLGACNAVTHLRGSLACLLAMPLAAPDALADPRLGWTVFGIGLVVLCLDGIDGWLARRAGLQSAFGARFDMETDSAVALLLAVLAWASGTAGPAVLLLGGARYLFWGATFIWPWLAAPLPERHSRKIVCVLQLGTLLALQAPALPGRASELAAVLVAALLAWSFLVDIRWLGAARAR